MSSDLPKLPGYSFDMPRQSYGKKQTFQVRDGTMVTAPPPRPSRDGSGIGRKTASLKIPRAPLDAYRKSREMAVSSTANAAESANATDGKGTPSWIAHSGQVLRFYAYFNESVHASATENFRVRKCVIYFHLEDGSIHIAEPHIVNSGMPQGVLLKRHRVPKPDGESYLEPGDLAVGVEVEIYGRVFRIVDADPSTRRYYAEHRGQPLDDAEEYPVDPFTAAAERRASPNAKTQSFTQSSSVNVQATRQFLQNDGKVLRFRCLYEDPMSNYEKRRYALLYYLADDTITVIENMEANSGRDPFPSLVRRQRLPKNFQKTTASVATIGVRPDDQQQGNDPSSYYTEEDLKIGEHVNVFGRSLLLTGCDPYTKDFYMRHFEMTDDDFPDLDEGDEEEKAPEAPPPAYTGFGSEEDSLGSLNSLMPKRPKKDHAKLQRFGDSNLRFLAEFARPGIGDEERRFVITFYMADDTVAVFEREVRNSGFMKGKFLERKRMKNPDTGKWFTPEDFFLGAQVTINHFQFRLVEGDEYSLKYMEGNTDIFPKADPQQVQGTLAEQGLNSNEALAALADAFVAIDTSGNGAIDKDEFAAALRQQGYELDQHQMTTLFRRYDKNNDGQIVFGEFVSAMQQIN